MASRIELAERFLQAFNRRKYREADLRDFVAPDAVIAMPPVGLELHGYEGVFQYNDAWVKGFSDGRVQDDVRSTDKGDYVETTFTGKGTFDGEFATPQGNVFGDGSHKVEVPFVQRCWVEGDKVTRVELHFDAQSLMKQMGLM